MHIVATFIDPRYKNEFFSKNSTITPATSFIEKYIEQRAIDTERQPMKKGIETKPSTTSTGLNMEDFAHESDSSVTLTEIGGHVTLSDNEPIPLKHGSLTGIEANNATEAATGATVTEAIPPTTEATETDIGLYVGKQTSDQQKLA
uniref:Uncharacterized protein n=1 Tax=Romanomermis culicivorax TaxID=13658 RepID=A0A915I153_ROMCU